MLFYRILFSVKDIRSIEGRKIYRHKRAKYKMKNFVKNSQNFYNSVLIEADLSHEYG